MRYELTEEQDIESERVHDLDSEYHENLCHYLHFYLIGLIDKSELDEAFNTAVRREEHLPPPWECDN